MAAGPAALALPPAPRCTPCRSTTSRPPAGAAARRHRVVIRFHDRVPVPAGGHHARAGRSDDPGLRRRARRRASASTPRTGTCCSGSSSPTSTPARAGPRWRRTGRPREDRHRLPLLLRRARRGAVPRPRPGRAPHRRRATRSACSRPPTTTPRCRTTSWPPAAPIPVRYNGSVARLNFGPVTAGPGAAGGSSAGEFDVLHLHEPVDAELSRARAVGGGGADRRDLPHLEPALAGDAGGLPAAAAEPGEDHRPHRRLRGRPPHRHDPPRRRRGRHPQRRLRRPVRLGGAAGRSGRARRSAPTIAFLGRIDEPRKGLPVLSPPRCPQVLRGASRACGCSSPAAATRTTARERLAPEVSRRLRVPRRGQRRGQGRAAGLGRPLRRAAHRRRELRHRARRGDERRRPGAGQRPAGLPAGAGRRRGRGDVRSEDADDLAAALLALLRRPGPRGAELAAGGPQRRRRVRLVGRGRPRCMAVYETVTSGATACGTTAEPTRRWAPAAARRPDGGRVVKDALSWVCARHRRPRARRLVPLLHRGPARPAARPGRGRAAAPWTPSSCAGPRPPLELANAGLLDPASALLLADAASESLEAHGDEHGDAGREAVENDLTEASCTLALGARRAGRAARRRRRRPRARLALRGSPQATSGCSWPGGSTTTPSPTCAGCGASAVVRWFRLAGHAAMPRTVEIDDELPCWTARR